MSNAIALPGVQVPARFQNRKVERLGEGISSGYPIIRIRGSKWWLSTGKEEEVRIPHDTITVVLLRDPEFNSRAYYKSYKGAGSKGDRPLCSSLRGITPDAGVQAPQSETCALCPRNKTYTDEKGITKRDCSNGRRLAVLPWVDWTTELLGAPLLRPVLLRVPGASLRALKDYGNKLARANINYYGLVTTISFEEDKEYPKLLFDYSQTIQLDDASAEIIDEMRESEEAMNVTGESGGSGEMREVDHTEEGAEETSKPKPAAVSLAAAFAKAKETKVVEGEVMPPEKEQRAKFKPMDQVEADQLLMEAAAKAKPRKPRANGKTKAEEEVGEARLAPDDPPAEVVEENADEGLKNEVMDILSKLGK